MGATCWDAAGQVGIGWCSHCCQDLGSHSEGLENQGLGREQKGRWGCWLHEWGEDGFLLACEDLESLGMEMGSECDPRRARGSAGGGVAELQGGDGVDDGGGRLEDKEVTTDLICGSNYARRTTKFLKLLHLISSSNPERKGQASPIPPSAPLQTHSHHMSWHKSFQSFHAEQRCFVWSTFWL